MARVMTSDFNLETYLPYLVHRLGPLFEDGFSEEFKSAGLTLQTWRVLAVLAKHGEQTVGDLSALTSINVSTLSRLVGRMERTALVTRRRQGEDGRTVTVALLRKGRDHAARLAPRAEAYADRLTESFTEAELQTLKQLLIKLHERFGAVESGEDRLAG